MVSGFHMRYYSANLMRGALVAAQPMQELEALVRAKFGAVPNADLAQPAFSRRRTYAVIVGLISRQPSRPSKLGCKRR